MDIRYPLHLHPMNSVVRLRVVAASHILLFLVLIFLLLHILTRIATGTVAAAERFQPMADIGRHGISLPAVQQPVCITRVLHQEMKRQRLVGLAVGISRNGHPVYVGGHGWADRESRTRVTNDTLFRWASLSKTLTAFAVMQQWEQGRLDIDADVRTYVPEYPPKSSVVTARQLLSHRGGLVRHTRYTRLDLGDNNNDSNNNVLHALDAFKAYPLRSTPSKAYAYSTYGYILLSAMVRRAARMPYPEYIQQHIARPFSLHTLQPDEHPHKDPHEATGYRIHGNRFVADGTVRDHTSSAHPTPT